MKNFLVAVSLAIAAAILGATVLAQVSEDKGIWKATPLSYPIVARLAQIQGDVRLDVEIDKTGHILSVAKISGPDALAATAAEEIKEWRYTSSRQNWCAALVIRYSLQKPLLSSPPVARVEIRTPFDVSVISNYPLPTGNPETMTPKR